MGIVIVTSQLLYTLHINVKIVRPLSLMVVGKSEIKMNMGYMFVIHRIIIKSLHETMVHAAYLHHSFTR